MWHLSDNKGGQESLIHLEINPSHETGSCSGLFPEEPHCPLPKEGVGSPSSLVRIRGWNSSINAHGILWRLYDNCPAILGFWGRNLKSSRKQTRMWSSWNCESDLIHPWHSRVGVSYAHFCLRMLVEPMHAYTIFPVVFIFSMWNKLKPCTPALSFP